MPQHWKHLLLIGAVALVVALFYGQVSSAWYCGYDDFNEAHRAAFFDASDPRRILTSTHNVTYMYRPVTSALQYATWIAFHHSAQAFRVRNLLMHLVSVGMLYGIAVMLTDSALVAAAAALLFGLSPMANETVVVGIWTNSTAYALVFGSLFFFLYSLRRAQRGGAWGLPLGASLLLSFVALFTYEPTIAVFALTFGYLGLCRIRGMVIPRAFLSVVLVATLAELVAFGAIRHLVVESAAPLNSANTMLRNAAMYATALLLPVDFVLANALFGTPLPSHFKVSPHLLLAGAVFAAVATITVAAALRNPAIRERAKRVDWWLIVYLACGAAVALLPLLLFREHPSEHDLYLSAALYALIVAAVLRPLLRPSFAYAAAIVLLGISFAAGISVRNARVEQCAAIAQRILTQLPTARWTHGSWRVELATMPGERLRSPYGIYNDDGLHTLEVDNGDTRGAQEAVQLATGNDRVTVRIVPATTLIRDCVAPVACFWVSASGKTIEAITLAAKRGAR